MNGTEQLLKQHRNSATTARESELSLSPTSNSKQHHRYNKTPATTSPLSILHPRLNMTLIFLLFLIAETSLLFSKASNDNSTSATGIKNEGNADHLNSEHNKPDANSTKGEGAGDSAAGVGGLTILFIVAGVLVCKAL